MDKKLGSGEGPDYHRPKEINDFGPISARIRGVVFIFILILTLSTGHAPHSPLWSKHGLGLGAGRLVVAGVP